MIPYWFGYALPPSRHTIENAVRLSFWGAGLGSLYCSCVRDRSPYKLEGTYQDQPFTMEWAPMDFLTVRVHSPEINESVLERSATMSGALQLALEQMLDHKPHATYTDTDGDHVIEWRVRGLKDRWAELQASGVKYLETYS